MSRQAKIVVTDVRPQRPRSYWAPSLRFGITEKPSLHFGINSEDVPRQILVLHNIGQHFSNVVGIHVDGLFVHIRRVEADFVEHALHDRIQPARDDIIRGYIHLESETGNFIKSFEGKCQLESLGFK
jgi:hypothetical protein